MVKRSYMINRRHLRIKVMQAAYALLLSENDNIDAQERYLFKSIDALHDLYLLQYALFRALWDKANFLFQTAKNKYIPSDSPLEKSDNFIHNELLLSIENYFSKNNLPGHIPAWKEHPEVVHPVWEQIVQYDAFVQYMALPKPGFEADKKIIIQIFRNIIAPHELLAAFYEAEVMTWVDDIPFVNTWILDNLKKWNPAESFKPDPLYKDAEDKKFAKELFRKVVLNFNKYEAEIAAKTPNWDSDRITRIDKLLIAMGMTEFLSFPQIPTKVTINEYIEISKDYATPKSGIFINGVLDKMLVDYKAQNAIQKSGRGLL